jgi:hypothetical protein
VSETPESFRDSSNYYRKEVWKYRIPLPFGLLRLVCCAYTTAPRLNWFMSSMRNCLRGNPTPTAKTMVRQAPAPYRQNFDCRIERSSYALCLNENNGL